MFKRMSVVFCGLAVVMLTAGAASAQTATEKTKAAAKDTGANITDAAITSAVKTKFLGDTKVSGLNIDVDTNNHIVTLTGPVHSAAEKAEAIRLARTTKGVKSVVSKLTIDKSAATTGRTDKDDKLKVVVKDDTKETAAKMKGAAKTGADKTGDAAKKVGEKTKDVAQDVGGKTKEVAKDTGANITDAAITSAVKTKFLGDTKVPGMDINVDTNNHVVTLTGTVKDAAAKAEAIRLAKTTKGVDRVVDKITIKQ